MEEISYACHNSSLSKILYICFEFVSDNVKLAFYFIYCIKTESKYWSKEFSVSFGLTLVSKQEYLHNEHWILVRTYQHYISHCTVTEFSIFWIGYTRLLYSTLWLRSMLALSFIDFYGHYLEIMKANFEWKCTCTSYQIPLWTPAWSDLNDLTGLCFYLDEKQKDPTSGLTLSML